MPLENQNSIPRELTEGKYGKIYLSYPWLKSYQNPKDLPPALAHHFAEYCRIRGVGPKQVKGAFKKYKESYLKERDRQAREKLSNNPRDGRPKPSPGPEAPRQNIGQALRDFESEISTLYVEIMKAVPGSSEWRSLLGEWSTKVDLHAELGGKTHRKTMTYRHFLEGKAEIAEMGRKIKLAESGAVKRQAAAMERFDRAAKKISDIARDETMGVDRASFWARTETEFSNECDRARKAAVDNQDLLNWIDGVDSALRDTVSWQNDNMRILGIARDIESNFTRISNGRANEQGLDDLMALEAEYRDYLEYMTDHARARKAGRLERMGKAIYEWKRKTTILGGANATPASSRRADDIYKDVAQIIFPAGSNGPICLNIGGQPYLFPSAYGSPKDVLDNPGEWIWRDANSLWIRAENVNLEMKWIKGISLERNGTINTEYAEAVSDQL